MSEHRRAVHDGVAILADIHLEAFAGFWSKPEDQQTQLIAEYGSSSDRALWDKRNAPIRGDA
jgi:hypothetical protein